jgi:hypothetical protein
MSFTRGRFISALVGHCLVFRAIATRSARAWSYR